MTQYVPSYRTETGVIYLLDKRGKWVELDGIDIFRLKSYKKLSTAFTKALDKVSHDRLLVAKLTKNVSEYKLTVSGLPAYPPGGSTGLTPGGSTGFSAPRSHRHNTRVVAPA